jgi:hypothetical protein
VLKFDKFNPRRLKTRLRRLEVLVGSNEDEGTKSLMYFLPYLFPNEEVENVGLSGHDFSTAVDRIFAHNSLQVNLVCMYTWFAF